jgi:hypothetical protein
MFIQDGGVKLSVVNNVCTEAIIALLGAGDSLGEGCLTGLPIRMGTATALTPITVVVIEKNHMIRALHRKQPRPARYSIKIAVQAVDMLTGRSISGHTSDVSPAGCCIETQYPLDLKSSVRIQFFHMGSTATVFGDGARGDSYGMAIRFRGAKPDQFAELKKWLFAGDR